MKFQLRFGRRLPIPSTAEIRAEYKKYAAKDDLRQTWALEENLPARAGWDEIITVRAERLSSRAETRDPAASVREP